VRDHGKLPATMESPDIEALVDELMDLADLRAAADADVAEGLIQLMERQAYNHVPLPDGIAGRIQDWVGRVWSDDDPDLDDALCNGDGQREDGGGPAAPGERGSIPEPEGAGPRRGDAEGRGAQHGDGRRLCGGDDG